MSARAIKILVVVGLLLLVWYNAMRADAPNPDQPINYDPVGAQ